MSWGDVLAWLSRAIAWAEAMWTAVLAWLAPAIAWVKASVTAFHSSPSFHAFGLAIDKQDALIGVTILVIAPVVLAVTFAAVHPYVISKINNRSTS